MNICEKAQAVCCAATGAARRGPCCLEHDGDLCLHTMMLIRSPDCCRQHPYGSECQDEVQNCSFTDMPKGSQSQPPVSQL